MPVIVVYGMGNMVLTSMLPLSRYVHPLIGWQSLVYGIEQEVNLRELVYDWYRYESLFYSLNTVKENNLQPRLLYPARISFKYEGEIKSFTDKQKLREFSNTKPALQQILKDIL